MNDTPTNQGVNYVQSGQTSNVPSYTYYTWPFTNQRVIDALERIANALEGMSINHPQCSICGKRSEWYITAPYPSEHDGNVICVECLDKALKHDSA